MIAPAHRQHTGTRLQALDTGQRHQINTGAVKTDHLCLDITTMSITDTAAPTKRYVAAHCLQRHTNHPGQTPLYRWQQIGFTLRLILTQPLGKTLTHTQIPDLNKGAGGTLTP